MADIEQIMNAIEAQLAGVTGLRIQDTVSGPINISGNASVAIIGVPAIPSFRATMGRARYLLAPEILVFTSAAMDRRGQRKLAAFAAQTGAGSVIAAIEGDTRLGGTIPGDLTLGGVVEQCWVEAFRPLGLDEVGLYEAFGGIFTLSVMARGGT